MASFPYSSFLRGPSDVLPELDAGDVVLERRDDENLVLTRSSRFHARSQGMTLAARLLGDVARERSDLVVELLRHELPWMRWLPGAEQTECADELVAELAAGGETGVLEPFVRALRAWQSTAEAWGDPHTARRLRGSFPGDGRAIDRPGKDR